MKKEDIQKQTRLITTKTNKNGIYKKSKRYAQ